jgi:hypothetical protein
MTDPKNKNKNKNKNKKINKKIKKIKKHLNIIQNTISTCYCKSIFHIKQPARNYKCRCTSEKHLRNN